MTMKVLTVRIPISLYSTLCDAAGEEGVSISIHVRKLLERENDVEQLNRIRDELLNKIESSNQKKTVNEDGGESEILWILRELAVDRNPQIMQKVRARIQQKSTL